MSKLEFLGLFGSQEEDTLNWYLRKQLLARPAAPRMPSRARQQVQGGPEEADPYPMRR